MKYFYNSARGEQLMYQGPPLMEKPVLTVENSTKWYHLSLVMPDGTVQVEPTDWYDLEGVVGTTSAFLDHAIHPDAFIWLANKNGYEIDPQALDLVTGRWMLEYFGTSTRAKEVSQYLNMQCIITTDIH